MTKWWFPIVEYLGKIALNLALKFLEAKHPGVGRIISKVVTWLHEQTESGNTTAVETLGNHVDFMCKGMGCPSTK